MSERVSVWALFEQAIIRIKVGAFITLTLKDNTAIKSNQLLIIKYLSACSESLCGETGGYFSYFNYILMISFQKTGNWLNIVNIFPEELLLSKTFFFS